MIRTQISMTEDQAERLRHLAEIRQRSQAALMREALDALLAREERAVRIERVRASLGQFRSGRSNVSIDHDAELEAAYLA